MDTIFNAPRYFRLYGAILAMAALLVVLLAATVPAIPTQAQVGVGPGQLPRTGDNAEEYSEFGALPCSEEYSNLNPAEVIDEGYYAVFDAFWDYEVGHLSNNFCPPRVTVKDNFGTMTYTRADANIHVSETVFSIPDSYKVTVIDTREGVTNGVPDRGDVTGPSIDIADFPFLAHGNAVSAVKPDPDSTEANPTTVFADNSLWWVRLDQPWTTGADEDETSPLQIGFSTDLLEEADWYKAGNGDPVKFRFDAVHVLKDGSEHEAHVVGAHFYAFDQRTTDTPLVDTQWSNVETATESEIEMRTGQYRPMQFAFTQPGVYRVQVNVEGYVRNTGDPSPIGGHADGWTQISPDLTITSPVQWYTFHVGGEDDLSVSIQPVDAYGDAISTIDSSDNEVDFEVSAVNTGLDAADALVQIHLPQGLTYSGLTDPSGDVDNPTAGTSVSDHCGGTIITWGLDGLAADRAVMTFTARVDDEAPGDLTATAEIRNLDPGVLDVKLDNNLNHATLVRDGAPVNAPSFGVWDLSILEHAIPGAHAGDPVRVSNRDGRELEYRLSGPCSDKFTAHGNGQVVLADGAGLNYEEQWAYRLNLEVSDGVDQEGASDPDGEWIADDSTEVLIEVVDTEQVTGDHPTVTFWLTLNNSDAPVTDNPVDNGDTYWLRTVLHNVPEGVTPTYDWDEEGWYNPIWSNRIHTSYYSVLGPGGGAGGQRTYTVHIKWPGGGITKSHTLTWDPKPDPTPTPTPDPGAGAGS